MTPILFYHITIKSQDEAFHLPGAPSKSYKQRLAKSLEVFLLQRETLNSPLGKMEGVKKSNTWFHSSNGRTGGLEKL
jgi:hypothetical protein